MKPGGVNYGAIYDNQIDYRVCNRCWRPIGPGRPVYWKTDRDNMPHPYHPGCK